jgi:hypothetical protein
MREWRYDSTILDLGTRWRRMVGLSPQPLYPQEKSPWYALHRRLVCPQSRSGCNGEEKYHKHHYKRY